jgi:hypothetical protein
LIVKTKHNAPRFIAELVSRARTLRDFHFWGGSGNAAEQPLQMKLDVFIMRFTESCLKIVLLMATIRAFARLHLRGWSRPFTRMVAINTHESLQKYETG